MTHEHADFMKLPQLESKHISEQKEEGNHPKNH